MFAAPVDSAPLHYWLALTSFCPQFVPGVPTGKPLRHCLLPQQLLKVPAYSAENVESRPSRSAWRSSLLRSSPKPVESRRFALLLLGHQRLRQTNSVSCVCWRSSTSRSVWSAGTVTTSLVRIERAGRQASKLFQWVARKRFPGTRCRTFASVEDWIQGFERTREGYLCHCNSRWDSGAQLSIPL